MKSAAREIEEQIAKIEREIAQQNAEFADAIAEFGTDEEIATLRPLTESKRVSPVKQKLFLGGFFRG